MDIIHKVPGFNHIYAHKSFTEEFCKMLGNNKALIIRYRKWMDRRLGMLEESGTSCIDGMRFEYIEPDIYSIRLPESKQNPRVIFTFCLGDQDVVLLTAFLEQRKADYEPAKRISRNRIVLIRREFDL